MGRKDVLQLQAAITCLMTRFGIARSLARPFDYVATIVSVDSSVPAGRVG